MAEEKKAQPAAAKPAAPAAAPASSAPKRDKTAAKPSQSYSLYDKASGKKLLSGVSRERAVQEFDRRKRQEVKDSILHPD